MFDFLSARAERRERNRRAARMMLRDHGPDALAVIRQRIEDSSGRDRAHWKRVYREALDQIAMQRRTR